MTLSISLKNSGNAITRPGFSREVGSRAVARALSFLILPSSDVLQTAELSITIMAANETTSTLQRDNWLLNVSAVVDQLSMKERVAFEVRGSTIQKYL
jgi:hypothetical protein